MRIAVYGAGGMAGSMGARLWQAGHDLAIIARGEHLKAIQQGGLRIEFREGGGFTATPRVATDDPSKVGLVDLVILGVKAWQVPEAARALLPMVGPETRVMTIQNGVEAPYQVAEVVPAERVITGAMIGGGEVVRPGCIRARNLHIPDPNLPESPLGQIAPERAGRTDSVARVQDALQDAGWRIVLPEDIRVALWNKFAPYAAFAGVAAVCRAPNGVLRQVQESRALMRRAAEEIVAVAHAQGIAVGKESLELLELVVNTWALTFINSAARDFLAGRPSEVVDFSGSVLRLGRAAGVPTPVNEFIYAALLPQELKALGQIAWPE
ncbi:MAG: 2-dehydropantoate 2-reductase [Chloroflexi bacterium]|nr:2-dehydropantoate 2-reductase [Chloroflexota bacterium]